MGDTQVSRSLILCSLVLNWLILMIIEGQNYACDTCVRGHRVRTCEHYGRPLNLVGKKGRPVSQCQHCRTLRKSRSAHVKCNCGKQASNDILRRGSTADEAGSCYCNYGGRCTCAHKKEQPPPDVTGDTIPQPGCSTELNMPYVNEGGFQFFGSMGEPRQEHLRVTPDIPTALSNHNTITSAHQQPETQLPLPGMSSNVGGYSTGAHLGLFCSPQTAASIRSVDCNSSGTDWANQMFDIDPLTSDEAQSFHEFDLRCLTQPTLGTVPAFVSEDVRETADCSTVAHIPCEDLASLPEPVPGEWSYTDPISEAKDLVVQAGMRNDQGRCYPRHQVKRKDDILCIH